MKREEVLQLCPLTLVSNHNLTRCKQQECLNVLTSRVPGTRRGVAQGDEEVEETPAETLYLGMLPNLSQFVVSGSGETLLRFLFLISRGFSLLVFGDASCFVCVRSRS